MYVPLDELVQQFGIIRKNSLSHTTCKLVIFVACLDIDALCSAKMLSQLLKADLIPHKIVPIAGFEELKEAYNSISDDEEITSVICIGCCATINLLEFLQVDESSNKTFYINDNHRPWNLENLFSTERVICFYDEDTDESSYVEKIKKAYINLLKLYEKQDKEQETDSEQENDNVDNDNDSIIDSDDEREDSRKRKTGNEDESESRPKRHAERVREARELQSQINKYEDVLDHHYSKGSYVSTSISSTIYSLISDLGVSTINSLWLAVVGSTSLDACHPHIYKILYPELKTEVLRLNPRSVNIESGSLNSRSSTPSSSSSSTSVSNPSSTTLSGDDDLLYPEPDYLFFLLRHWSLYASMMHSSYISAKLRLYTEDGRRKLKTMLAKMGISLHDAGEQWTHANITVKKTLLRKLSDVSNFYGIEDVIREGIVRRFGFKGSVSAGDCVDSLVTLLQVGHLIENSKGNGISGLSSNSTNRNGFPENDSFDEIATRERFWVPNFWTAWDAMDRLVTTNFQITTILYFFSNIHVIIIFFLFIGLTSLWKELTKQKQFRKPLCLLPHNCLKNDK